MALPPTRAMPHRRLQLGESQASLRTIMTAPPMSADMHAAIAGQRTRARHLAEDARERRALASDDWRSE